MKVQMSITTETGAVYAGEMQLSPAGKAPKKAVPLTPTFDETQKIDFSLPVRPFVKRYASGLRSGPKRLTLLVARIAGGKGSTQIQRSHVVKQWSKMTSLMGGGFNSAYETRARDNGWIGSPKGGVYELLPSWREIFSS